MSDKWLDEIDKNLLVVTAVEGYAHNHNIEAKTAFKTLSNHNMISLVREQYDALHTQKMGYFEFNGQDITLDVLMKIEKVVRLLAKSKNTSFDKMLGLFYESKTYRNLSNTQSRLWAESAEFIADDYERIG